jgi:sigma-B regulation protein RsbU (phosphoserine phosphatase)
LSTEPSTESRELHAAKRHIAELEALVGTVDLLDPRLDRRDLAQSALEVCLRVLPADAALLVTAEDGAESAFYLRRNEDKLRELASNPSALAHEVIETGEVGERREPTSPGALAAAEVLGEVPALRVAVPMRRLNRTLGALEVVYVAESGPWHDEEWTALRTVADHVAAALDNARLVRDHANRVRELSHLYDISTKISAHLDLDAMLEAIVDSMERLVPVDAIGIFLLDPDTHEVFSETFRGYEDSERSRVSLKAGRGIVGWVARNEEGIIVPDVLRDDRYVSARAETRSEMAAPLKYEGKVIGVFNVESDVLNAYRPRHLDLLLSFCNHASISIMNAHLHSEALEKRRLEDQLEVARDIQEALLPRTAPQIRDHVLVGKNISSSTVGGDYFDFVPLSEGRWAILIADVSGNGVPAGLIMAGFRSEMRAELRRYDDPRLVLGAVNRVLCDELDPDHFVTAFLGVYSPDTGTLVYSNAGHEAGLLVRRNASIERLSEGGLILGVFEDAVYQSAMVHLARGDRLVLYTDGLSDAGDPWGDLLGEEGILRLLCEAEAERMNPLDVPEAVLARAEREAAAPPDEADDRTLVLLSRREEGAASRDAASKGDA